MERILILIVFFFSPPLVPTPPSSPSSSSSSLPSSPMRQKVDCLCVSMTTLCRPVRGGSEAGVPGRKGPHLADHLSMSTA
uniref:Secreted protein n=1 Tax=Oreochromis niloticus TaxID=8128 RepID=A0A669E8C7_ORENI